MKWLDLTLNSPEENLALDEALLNDCDAGNQDEVLRFWEPMAPFVVLGYSNRWSTEVNVGACERRRIPILRRCSGGGTVLQGPGCLNYSVILRIDGRGPVSGITETNRYVLERNADALAGLLPKRPRLNGHTDLTLDGLKFSGNSQRRRRHFTLMHGTFLLGADLALMEECLPMPSLQPEYRANRSHAKFVTNLDLSPAEVKNALKNRWETSAELMTPPVEQARALAASLYAKTEWSRKF